MFKGKKIIAVCISKAFEVSSFRYIQLLNNYALKKGFKLFVYQTCTDLFDNSKNDIGEKYVFDLIDYDYVDGVVIFSEKIKDKVLCRSIADKAIARNIPVVNVEGYMEGCINLRYDYGDCFEKIVRHVFVDHKLTKVNFIAGFEGNEFSEERFAVYKKVLKEQGIPYDPERVGYGNFWDGPTRTVMDKFLADGKELPEAIICCNDAMAMTACTCLKERGYKVPEDVIVTGFDGIEDEKYHFPRLTTCKNRYDEMSRCIVDLLSDAIDGVSVPEDSLIKFEMVISQSCGCVERKVNDASDTIRELYNRLTTYQMRNNNMTIINNMINIVRNPEKMIEGFSKKAELNEVYICLNKDALNQSSGTDVSSSQNPFTDEMLMLYNGCTYNLNKSVVKFNRKDIAPGIEEFLTWNTPVIFVSLHCLDVPLGYICMYAYVDIISYERISQVAEALSSGFGSVRMINAMEYLNTHDPLTDLYNRRGFYQLISSHFSQNEKKKNGNVTIVSADLDGLKYINDTFGHSEGDNAIKAVAAALKYASQNDEICARFGGDEFVVAGFANDTDSYADNFRKLVYEYLDEHNSKSGKSYKVASSLGIICCCRQDSSIDELIKMSDDLMYSDKATRKQVRNKNRDSD